MVWFAWVNDERLILQGATLKVSPQNRRGTPLAAVNADGSDINLMFDVT